MIGTTIGPYTITEDIGAGGMGVVYKARDSKLGRDVAVKVLPEAFGTDPERMARFEREAKLLASLNHPGIAGIYGLEESDGRQVIVMELVEGEDLAQRLASGPLSVSETVRVARQVAAALEVAHESGIIHRDIKPANIKVTPAGTVKVLDFGLAKAVGSDGGDVDMANSPTISISHRTVAGVILGTAAYMSPEQARGKRLDKRTDVWSFGCVLYDCLTGKPAFAGETVTDTIARILERDPDWGALPSGIPPRLRRLLERCLQKDTGERLRDIGDARIELDEIASGAPEPAAEGASPAGRRRPLLWMGAGLLIGAVLTAAGLRLREPAPAPARAVRLTMTLPEDARMLNGFRKSLTIPPDGHGIVYAGVRKGTYWIFRRDFDAEDPTPVPGTQDGSYPFFSPDGKWMGFSSNEAIMKVPAEGGTPISIHPGVAYFGVVWTREGYLIVSTSLSSGLEKIPAAGGEATSLTTPAEGELGHWWPSLLPDGQHVLFTCWRTTLEDASVRVLSLDSGEQRELIQGASFARYLPTGHLVFTRGSALLAVPFDTDRLELTGSPVVVVDSVDVKFGDGSTTAAFSKDGTLVYHPSVSAPSRQLVRVEPGPDSGHPLVKSLFEGERNYLDVAASPDGRRLALGLNTGTQSDIWVLDTQRAALTRLTFDGTNRDPLWTPDGREITFRSLRHGPYEIFQIPADGSGKERKLYGTPDDLRPVSWSPDRRLLFEAHISPRNRDDIWVLDMSGQEPEAVEYLATEYDENDPRFSPDGKWVLYTSVASGRREVYLQSYPPGGGRVQVSLSGGRFPLWSPDGQAVYYWSESTLMRSPVTLAPRLEIGNPVAVLDESTLPGTIVTWTNAPSGKGFIAILQRKGTERPLQVVQNWFQEVERLAGGGR